MDVAEFAILFGPCGIFLLTPGAWFEFRRPLLNIAPYVSTGLAGYLYYLAEFSDVLLSTGVSLAIVAILHLLLVLEQRRERQKK